MIGYCYIIGHATKFSLLDAFMISMQTNSQAAESLVAISMMNEKTPEPPERMKRIS